MLKVFIGYDPRQAVAYQVLHHSLVTRSSVPLSITPLILEQLPIERVGLTPFTYSRFLVPWLCNYEGLALFLDCDILSMIDIAELFALADEKKAVQVVKKEQAFEWSSVMLFNCAKCQILTPEYVGKVSNLHHLRWLDIEQVGLLPAHWNHLVGYDPPEAHPALIHYTQGVPGFNELAFCEHAEQWKVALNDSLVLGSWEELMGHSVHVVHLSNGAIVPRLFIGEAEIKRRTVNATQTA